MWIQRDDRGRVLGVREEAPPEADASLWEEGALPEGATMDDFDEWVVPRGGGPARREPRDNGPATDPLRDAVAGAIRAELGGVIREMAAEAVRAEIAESAARKRGEANAHTELD